MSLTLQGTPSGGPVTTPVTISFNEIPNNILVPGTYVEIAANLSKQGLLAYPARGLIIAPKLAAGSATADVPVSVWSVAQAEAAFGVGSIGAAMAAAWLAANPWTPFDMLAVADPLGATASTWTVTLGGSVLANGNLALYIDGTLVQVPVSAAIDTPASVATNLAAAVNANLSLPVSAAAATDVVTLTSRQVGIITTGIDVRLNYARTDATPAGLTANVAVGTLGTGAHVLGTALAAIAADAYTHAALAFNDSANLLSAAGEGERRFNAMVGLECLYFSVLISPLTNLLTQNPAPANRFLYLLGLQNSPASHWRLAASLAGAAAYALSNDPARQLRTLPLPGLLPPAAGDRFDRDEEQMLLAAGIGTVTVDRSGVLRLQRVVSTYIETPSGVPDTAWQDITTASVVIRVRYDWSAYTGAVWPRNELADDGSMAAEYDPTIATPRRLWSSWAARLQLYEKQGWIEGSAASAAQSVFVRDTTNRNRVDARQALTVIGNLMILAGQIDFSL